MLKNSQIEWNARQNSNVSFSDLDEITHKVKNFPYTYIVFLISRIYFMTIFHIYCSVQLYGLIIWNFEYIRCYFFFLYRYIFIANHVDIAQSSECGRRYLADDNQRNLDVLDLS